MSIWIMVRHASGAITGNNVTADWEGRDRPLGEVGQTRIDQFLDTSSVYVEADDYPQAIDAARAVFAAHLERRTA